MSNYIISLSNIPEALYMKDNAYKHQFVFNKYLLPPSTLITKEEVVKINGKAYIVEDIYYLQENIILKCREDD